MQVCSNSVSSCSWSLYEAVTIANQTLSTSMPFYFLIPTSVTSQRRSKEGREWCQSPCSQGPALSLWEEISSEEEVSRLIYFSSNAIPNHFFWGFYLLRKPPYEWAHNSAEIATEGSLVEWPVSPLKYNSVRQWMFRWMDTQMDKPVTDIAEQRAMNYLRIKSLEWHEACVKGRANLEGLLTILWAPLPQTILNWRLLLFITLFVSF